MTFEAPAYPQEIVPLSFIIANTRPQMADSLQLHTGWLRELRNRQLEEPSFMADTLGVIKMSRDGFPVFTH